MGVLLKTASNGTKWASDLEFVKMNNRAYVRSAVFLKFSECPTEQKTTETFIVTLKPEVTLAQAHTLPTGHAIRSAQANILHDVSLKVSLNNIQTQNSGSSDFTRCEKELISKGFSLLQKLGEEILSKKVYCVPNIGSMMLQNLLRHEAFEQILNRVSRSGSRTMYSIIEQLSIMSATLSTTDGTLRKSFFLRILMEFLHGCYRYSEEELKRIHHLLLQNESQVNSESKQSSISNSSSSTKKLRKFEASTIKEVGKHIASFLLENSKKHGSKKLYFYGSSDLHALIETLERYQKGITVNNEHIRNCLFHSVDYTMHESFNIIYRYWGYRIPKLHEALETLHHLGGTSEYQNFLSATRLQSLLQDNDHHNPVWDADALQNIVLACEWFQSNHF